MTQAAAVYARISKDRAGAGLGVDRQLADCRALADRLGWSVVAEHTDNDLSAYSGKPRPGYRALLDDLRNGRADAVLAWHTDRLHRSPVELEEFVGICEQHRIAVQTVQAGAHDLSTASGLMVARMLGTVARYEVDHMIERQKAAKLQAARSGRFRGGRRAFGFESDGVTVRPGEAAAVLDATHRVLHGDSLGSIAREWNTSGLLTSTGQQWTGIAVHRLLARARNAGLIEHSGDEVGPACWPAIVPVDVWRAVRIMLADPRRRYPRERLTRWLGSGLFLCGVCDDGTAVKSACAAQSNRNQHQHVYRCKAGAHLGRVAQPVDDWVTRLVIARLSRSDSRLLLKAQDPDDTDALTADAAALRVRLTELAELFAHGQVTAAQLADGTVTMRQQLADVEVQLAARHTGSPLAGFADADDVRSAWDAATVSRRKAVIDALMVVTLLPAPRGRRPGGQYFDPDYVRVNWR